MNRIVNRTTRIFLSGIFLIGSSLAFANVSGQHGNVGSPAGTSATSENVDSYVQKAEARIQTIDERVGALKQANLGVAEQETLKQLETKKKEAADKVAAAKAAPQAEKPELVKELSETMNAVEQLYAQLSMRRENPTE